MAPLTQLLIADSLPIVRLGIRTLLAAEYPDVQCQEAESVQAARRMITTRAVDLAVVELSLDHGAGLQLIRELHEAAPQLPVVVFSAQDELVFAESCLKAGARGYVMKSEPVERLAGAIRKVLSGQICLSDRVSQQMLARSREAAPKAFSLTDREVEVLHMIGAGLSTVAVAHRLGLSVKTVETYRFHIKTKLGLRDATELIRYATLRTAMP